MKRLVKTGVFMMLVLMILASQKNVAEAKTKVIYKKMTIDLNRDSSFFRCTPTKLQKYSKVKVCVKNRKVLKAKAKGRKYIVMKWRKGGKTAMTASLYKKYRQVPKKQCFRGSIAQGIIETLRTKDIIDAH